MKKSKENKGKILILLLQGKTISEISKEVGLTESGVKWNITHILRENGVKSTKQLIIKMGAKMLVEQEAPSQDKVRVVRSLGKSRNGV